jgi:hypothetical protein
MAISITQRKAERGFGIGAVICFFQTTTYIMEKQKLIYSSPEYLQ